VNIPVIDIIFLIFIALMISHGYVRGFIRVFFSWAALVAAVLIAVFLHPTGAAYIREKIMPDVRYIPEILAFIAIFLIVMLICKMLEKVLHDVVKGTHLGSLDKVLGLIFGLIEGFAVIALVLFVLSVQPVFDTRQLIEESYFAGILLPHIKRIPLDNKDIINYSQLI
jgi:membrane protein required for colicin V production